MFTTVTNFGWGVSFTCIKGEDVVLNLYKFPLGTHRSKPTQYGSGNGMKFKTVEEASEWALEHGFLQEYFSGVWCRKCRILHYDSMSKRTGFCPVHKETCL